MIRIRRMLARSRTNLAVATLLLLIVAFRLLLPPGLMLTPSTGTTGDEPVICSGHGTLFDGTSAISADPAAKTAAENLAEALARSTGLADHGHATDLCPFSAALALGHVTTLPLGANRLGIFLSARLARPVNAVVPAAPTHGLLGARAPPFLPFA